MGHDVVQHWVRYLFLSFRALCDELHIWALPLLRLSRCFLPSLADRTLRAHANVVCNLPLALDTQGSLPLYDLTVDSVKIALDLVGAVMVDRLEGLPRVLANVSFPFDQE